MQSLVDLSLLELADDLHILPAYGALLEIVELGGIVGEVQQVDLSLVFAIELIDIGLHIEVVAGSGEEYLPSRTMRSVSSFLDWPAVHLLMSYCLMFIVFSCSLNFFSCARTLLKNSALREPS